MKTTARSESEAVKASRRVLLKAGWYDARISEASEKPSKRGNDMIEITVLVPDAEGNERTLRDWLTDTAGGAAKLRHACEAVGALARYDAGEIGEAAFPGHDVQVKVSIEKRRGFPDQNRIEDYRTAADSRIVSLRTGG